MTDDETRDMFAAQAIPVLASRFPVLAAANTHAKIACCAYDIADAMMAEREKRAPKPTHPMFGYM